ncbi:MAG: class I SAM-dependent methyltransferase [Bacteroidia bacterium]|nr:class I SAM-dependent methyltransferase [Bacteroidia bacterium]
MKEEDIRPQEIFDTYLKLTEQDTLLYFDKELCSPIPCPACGSSGIHSFIKHNFSYEECPDCLTLFVSPRPPAEAFTKYYTESESTKYWATTFYKSTAEARRERLWKPKALLIEKTLSEYCNTQYSLIDIGGGYGIFAEEYEKLSGQKVTVIEPGPSLADVCREKGLITIEAFLEDIDIIQLPNGPKAFVSFELFEHLYDPNAFLEHLFQLMSPGDVFIFTTLSGSGVDIQTLWENSKSVSPPHHLNFFNPRSIQSLLQNTGFDKIKVTTPGKLDIDIMTNSFKFIKDKFWRTFIEQSDEPTKQEMQSFISDHGFSSHMMVICQKN